MRSRWTLLTMTALTATLVVGAALAHPGRDLSPQFTAQATQFQAAVAAAKKLGKAPKTSAPCIRGMAAGTYPCSGVDLLSHLSLEDLGVSFVNDIWGWTDPSTKNDYALVGAIEGTVIVDISDPKRPDIVGTLPAHTLDPDFPFWRDIKVYADHMYVVSEQTDHGLQVFDLTTVRGVTGAPVTFAETAHYDDFSWAHNLNINTETGYAYVVGSNTCAGGLHMVDIRAPASPAFAGCFAEQGYIHDTQCVVYRGPDAEHRGRELCFNSAAEFVGPTIEDIVNTVSIVDVTNKAAPVILSVSGYPNAGYSHQGWLTPDQRFFLHGDELDEELRGVNTTTRIWDVRDVDGLKLHGVFENTTASIDHNLYTQGDVAYASNYTSGLRLYDTRLVAQGRLAEIGFFDVYPENDDPTFEGGTWSNYAYFGQKKVVAVSSMDRGLFVVRPHVGAGGN